MLPLSSNYLYVCKNVILISFFKWCCVQSLEFKIRICLVFLCFYVTFDEIVGD